LIPGRAEGDAQNETSEWELWKRSRREKERRQETEELGAEESGIWERISFDKTKKHQGTRGFVMTGDRLSMKRSECCPPYS